MYTAVVSCKAYFDLIAVRTESFPFVLRKRVRTGESHSRGGGAEQVIRGFQ